MMEIERAVEVGEETVDLSPLFLEGMALVHGQEVERGTDLTPTVIALVHWIADRISAGIAAEIDGLGNERREVGEDW